VRGCLSLPFRLLGLALLVLAGYLAWTYRREIRRQIHEWTAERGAPEATGRAGAAGAPDARTILRRVDSLRGAGADSVVLSPAELASLAEGLAAQMVPGAVDSVTIRLGRDDVEIRARVDTRKVPISFGPISGILRDHEYVEAGGRLVFRRIGQAELEVERVRVRGLPVPRNLIDGMIRQFRGQAAGPVIPLTLSREVTGFRVEPGRLTVYGRGVAGRVP
jgi:hypothetical protein